MRVVSSDPRFLEQIRQSQLRAYLTHKGWLLQRRLGIRGELWSPPAGSEHTSLIIPADESLADTSLRLAEALSDLEEFEERPIFEIAQDIQATTSDVVRISVSGSQSSDGRIPFDSGTALYRRAREALVAAACAALDKRPNFPNNRPQRVADYLKLAKLGQTERGSYVMTIHSPLVAPGTESQGTLLADAPEPFERKVVATLGTALHRALQRIGNSPPETAINDDVNQGLSANLCVALAEMVDRTGGETVRFAFTWAIMLPPSRDLPLAVTFEPKHAEQLREVGRRLKELRPEQVTVEGTVEKLDRDTGAARGRVALRANIYGGQRRVWVELPPDLYHVAVLAHDNKTSIRCVGDLVRPGRSFVLENVAEFTNSGGKPSAPKISESMSSPSGPLI